MKPILIELGPVKVYAFGLFLALAFLFGGWLGTRRGMKHGLRDEDMTRWITFLVIVSIAGARIYYVLLHPERFAGHWADALAIWKGGLVIHGGLLAGVVFTLFYARSVGWKLGVLADVGAPSLALGEAIGRIGCFLNGCCYGKPSSGPLAVVFPEGCSAHAEFGSAPLYPTQLYLVLLHGFVGIALLLLGRNCRLFSVGRGALFGAYLVGTAAVRFYVDIFRHYDPDDRWILGLAHSQLVAIALAAVGVWLVVAALVRAGREEARP